MPEPIPPNPNLQPERLWFEIQAKLLENAVGTHSDTSGLSNHLLWLINVRANSSPEAQNGSLSEVYQEILFENDIEKLHGSLSQAARKVFAGDVITELSTPDEELPEHAAWLKSDPSAQGASPRALLKEALVSKFPEVKQIVDPYDRGIGVESITAVHSITDSELQALLDPNRVAGSDEPVHSNVPEVTFTAEEASESAGEITNTFEQELAECQDAVQLRTLLEERAEATKEAIRIRAQEAKKAIMLLDNNDSVVLERAEELILARELSAARKLIKDHASSPAKYQQLMTAIQDKEVDTIAGLIRSNNFNYSTLIDSIDGFEVSEGNRAEFRAIVDASLIGSIEYYAGSDDPIEQQDALPYLQFISDPKITDKVKEIFDFKVTDIIPEMPEVPNEGIREPTLEELANSMYRSKNEIEGKNPYNLTDQELEEALRRRRDIAKRALLVRSSNIEAKLSDENPEAILVLRLAKAAARSNKIVEDGKLIGFPIAQANQIIRESVFDDATKRELYMALNPLVLDWAERIVDHRWPEQFDMSVSDKMSKKRLDKMIQAMRREPVLYARKTIYLQSSRHESQRVSPVMLDALSYTVYKEAKKILEDGSTVWKHPLQRALGYIHEIDTTSVKGKIPHYDSIAQRMSLALRQPQINSASGDFEGKQME